VTADHGKRWRIETDLRSLKQTVRLQHLSVQSTDMMEKELLVAVLAYNLVRTIMYVAAQRSGGDPRQLSFTYACNIVLDGYPKILAARGAKQQEKELNNIIDLVARCKRDPARDPDRDPATGQPGHLPEVQPSVAGLGHRGRRGASARDRS